MQYTHPSFCGADTWNIPKKASLSNCMSNYTYRFSLDNYNLLRFVIWGKQTIYQATYLSQVLTLDQPLAGHPALTCQLVNYLHLPCKGWYSDIIKGFSPKYHENCKEPLGVGQFIETNGPHAEIYWHGKIQLRHCSMHNIYYFPNKISLPCPNLVDLRHRHGLCWVIDSCSFWMTWDIWTQSAFRDLDRLWKWVFSMELLRIGQISLWQLEVSLKLCWISTVTNHKMVNYMKC
jgi:hypothetical protein